MTKEEEEAQDKTKAILISVTTALMDIDAEYSTPSLCYMIAALTSILYSLRPEGVSLDQAEQDAVQILQQAKVIYDGFDKRAECDKLRSDAKKKRKKGEKL